MKITTRKHDPDKLRYNFWMKHRKYAPRKFSWENGWTHYDYVHGYHPSKPGVKVMAALEDVWGERKFITGQPTDYRMYMGDKMNHIDVVFSFIKGLTQCTDVVGDCTMENIVITTEGKVVILDPGYPRGLYCTENDHAKMLQSARGWELVKAGRQGTDYPLEAKSDSVVAIYVTHLYRLLRHKHSEWCYRWAKREIENAVLYLSNRC